MVIAADLAKPPAESDLLSRARTGDADAFCLLIEPLQATLLRQAILLSGEAMLAEDLVSETLVAAWTSLARYDEKCRLSTWLYSILLHRHQNSVRRARSRPLSMARLPQPQADELNRQAQELISPEPSPTETTARNETLAHLRSCIERLPEKHRQIVLFRFFEGSSLEDIARMLGCSVGTVKSRLHHALEKLRKMKVNLLDAKGDK